MNHHRFFLRHLCFFCILFIIVGTGSALIGLLSQRNVGAQPPFVTSTPDPNKEWENRIDTFFKDLIAAGSSSSSIPSKPFEDLLRDGPLVIPTGGSEALTALRSKLGSMRTQFGAFQNHEKIDVKLIGKDLILARYLLKCENHPIVWNFSIYRRPSATTSLATSGSPTITTPTGVSTGDTTTSPWFVIGVKCDPNLEQLLVTPTLTPTL